MLEHLVDVAFTTGSCIADNSTTYLSVKKHGIDIERNINTRKGMSHQGVGNYLLKSGFRDFVSFISIGGLFLGIDNLIQIEDYYLNMHHTFLYGIGGLKYLAAVTNIATASGMHRTAKIISLPIRLCLKILQKNRYDL